MRQRLPWLIVMPLMVAGSMGAHALSGLLAATPAEHILAADGDGGSERPSVGVAAHSVLPAGVLLALAVTSAMVWLIASRALQPGVVVALVQGQVNVLLGVDLAS